MASTCAKRKRDSAAPGDSKRLRLADPPSAPATSTPLPTSAHEPLLSTLSAKYSVLTLSFISSTQLRTRISRIVEHMAGGSSSGSSGGGSDKPAIVMLHARPADVGKMISAAEKAKALMAADKKTWVQYNKLFLSAAKASTKKTDQTKKMKKSVEKNTSSGTAGEGDPSAATEDGQQGNTQDGNGQEEDYFESTAQRFADAANPPKPTRPTMSLSIFLSVESIPELRNSPGVTVQTSDAPPA